MGFEPLLSLPPLPPLSVPATVAAAAAKLGGGGWWQPSSSIMTGSGMMVVQRRFSMREEIIDKDESKMLVSMTRTVYPGMIDNGSRESMAFFDARALGQRWGGDELIAAFSCLAD